ncbi:MAG: DNA-processing protein DprA [Deltaproteobacteria bacterium]|nr:DNA-processing protein DprA [Deltaproteobacteria bacterium]
MSETAHDLLPWLALDAARVPGRARPHVLERGAERVLHEGELLLHGPARRVAWDPERTLASGQRALAFLEQGGLVLGGPDAAALGRAAARKRPPLLLYGRGHPGLLERPALVAVVGTREPSPVGLTRARRLAEALVEVGAVTVSGGARGIDRAAHEAALEAGGQTVAVLGQPAGLARDERQGWMQSAFDAAGPRALSVTPYAPSVPEHPALFAARNWTLAALVDAVVVVEGALGSGTRHTARAAGALGVPVFTWPSDAERVTAAMPNALLASGRASALPGDARAAVARMLADHAPAGAPLSGPAAAEPPHPLADALAAAGGVLLLDQAATALGLGVAELLGLVVELELDGRLAREGPALRLLPAGR